MTPEEEPLGFLSAEAAEELERLVPDAGVREKVVRLVVSQVRRRPRHDPQVIASRAHAEMRKAGYEPLEPYPGVEKPWRARCMVCGQERAPLMGAVRAGERCGHLRVFTAEEAAELVKQSGYQPLEPYPGNVNTGWRVKCRECGRTRNMAFHLFRSGQTICLHGGRLPRHSAEEAVAAMQDAGLEPLEPYPGTLTRSWRARCKACSLTRSVALRAVLLGWRCGHRASQRVEAGVGAS